MDTNLIESIVKRVMSEQEKANDISNGFKEVVKVSDNQGVSDLVFDCKNIKLDKANYLIDKVIKKADEIGVKAVCAVVDSGARPVSVQSADGAFIASYDIALNKAYTSVSLKMKTSQLKNLAQPGASLYGIQHTNGGKIVIFGGGVPLKVGNEIIGGFGVSGGSEEQDTYLSEYAEEVFKSLI